MTVPYTFSTATAAIPLSQLDSNFATAITLGNTAVYLGNTTTSFGNLTLTNATIVSLSSPISPAQGGTGLTTITANGLMVGNGTSNVTIISAGTSGNVLTSNGTAWLSVTPTAGITANTTNTFTATQTFNGNASTFAVTLLDANETVNVVAAAPSATTNFYIQSGGVQYYTSNAANNWTLNIAFSSGTSLNTALSTGQSVTFTLVTTQGSTAYYNSAVTIDGTSVTPKWIGGAPTAGNASGLDVYRGSIIKTASATYTVIMSLTQFK